MCFSSPSMPTPPPAPTPQSTAREQDAAITSALERERKARAAQRGRASTILTGAAGAAPTAANLAGKTLLGQ